MHAEIITKYFSFVVFEKWSENNAPLVVFYGLLRDRYCKRYKHTAKLNVYSAWNWRQRFFVFMVVVLCCFLLLFGFLCSLALSLSFSLFFALSRKFGIRSVIALYFDRSNGLIATARGALRAHFAFWSQCVYLDEEVAIISSQKPYKQMTQLTTRRSPIHNCHFASPIAGISFVGFVCVPKTTREDWKNSRKFKQLKNKWSSSPSPFRCRCRANVLFTSDAVEVSLLLHGQSKTVWVCISVHIISNRLEKRSF